MVLSSITFTWNYRLFIAYFINCCPDFTSWTHLSTWHLKYVVTSTLEYQDPASSSNYKFSKGITLESVSYALDLIGTAHGDVPEGLSFSDFYLGELTQIYPTLNIEIGRHFVLEREAKHEANPVKQ